ncbi:MAG: diaminopimelate epimerase [Acidobacteria bacterium]|nr:diaminopimelate epimerase [Acidobacteriota bacterium]
MLPFLKAHAYGNDFLYVTEDDAAGQDPAALARTLCARHTGVGADGLILYRPTPRGAAMRLFNADGSYSEVSGNGVRALGAVLLHGRADAGNLALVVDTDAGEKRLDLLRRDGTRLTFRAAMGMPEAIVERTLEVGGEALRVVTLRVGNPQCVAVEGALSLERMHRLGALLEHHEAFPEGTNVEFATVESPSRVRILIWERGVGPTLASGTGACASAVAAAVAGGASRDVEVAAPGGTQRVEWTGQGLFLTGWAEVLCRGTWLA